MRVGYLPLLLAVNLASCDGQSIQFEETVDAPLASEALPAIGPFGPLAAGLANGKLSRDLTSYSFGAGVDRGSLNQDFDMIEQTRNALPPAANRINVLKKLHSDVDPDVVDLGFDQLRISFKLRGGYSDCEFQMILYYDDLQELDVKCYWDNGASEAVDAALRNAFGPGFSIARGTARGLGRIEGLAHYDFPRMKARAAERLHNELGPMNQVDVPEDLKDAFEMLMSPKVQHTVGSQCSYAGIPPPANLATRKLINADRADLLRNVLHGPNPEARVYAAWGLTRLEALSEADRRIIDKLRHLDITMLACYGCMTLGEPSAEVWTNFEQQYW